MTLVKIKKSHKSAHKSSIKGSSIKFENYKNCLEATQQKEQST